MNNYKFNRQYVLAVQYGEYKKDIDDTKIEFAEGDKQLVINPFFTIKFTVDRGIYASINTFTIDIYNLNKETREALYYDGILLGAVAKNICFFCGYNPDFKIGDYKDAVIHQTYDQNFKKKNQGVPLVFAGRVTRCYSYRQGTDFITHIEGFDLPEKNEVDINEVLLPNTKVSDMVYLLARKMGIDEKNVYIDPQFLEKYNKSFSRPKNVKNFKAWETVDKMISSINNQIQKEEGKNAPLFKLYHDLYTLVLLRDDAFLGAEGIEISAETGLLNTPIREGAKITFKSLFEPSFRCGGFIRLISRTAQTGISGVLKVVGFKHIGTISQTICESMETEFTCFLGTNALRNL